jgi:hypothetical protein
MRYQQEEYRGYQIIYDTVNGWADVVVGDVERRIIAEDDTIENCAHAYIDFLHDLEADGLQEGSGSLGDEIDRRYNAAREELEEALATSSQEEREAWEHLDKSYGGTDSDD